MLIGFFTSLLMGLVAGYVMIPLLRRLKFGQEVRDDGPQSHLSKQGTPTMGGILFFLAVPLGVLVSGAGNQVLFFLVMASFFFGAIGLADDALKIVFRHSEGLTPKQKILLQLLVSIGLILWALQGLGLSSSVWIPVFNHSWDAGFLYWPFMIFVILGTTNSCNLTDGLDGLLSTVSFLVFLGFVAIGAYQNDRSVMVFAFIMVAACLAFLAYNRHPAKVFMGDTGSFFIGGAVVALAMVTKTEFLLPLIGLIYMLESVSDIIQVLVYKKTRRRVFKMAPLHHHFELSGLKETQVVALFAAVSMACVVLSLIVLNRAEPSLFFQLKGW